jgi:lipopolysaccharide export system protein LptA
MTRPISKHLSLIMLALFFPHVPLGQQNTPTNNGALHIEAKDSLSCHEPGNVWVARGNVVLRKNDLTLKADCIHLIFEPKSGNPWPKKSKSSLLLPAKSPRVKIIYAMGNVTLAHPSGTLTCHKATYTFPEKMVTAYGPSIRMDSAKWNLSCTQSLSYSYVSQRAKALGNAFLHNDDMGIESQELWAQFGSHTSKNPRTKKHSDAVFDTPPLTLHWAKSPSPVRIWGKKYVARAETVLFDALNQKVYTQGDVRIRHKTEYIKANQVTINLKEKTMAFSHDGGQVSGLIPIKTFSGRRRGAL